MAGLLHNATVVVLAKEDSGNFLVRPGIGLMIWTLITFGITLYILGKVAFPRIQEALDRRQKTIEESIEAAERTQADAERLLAEYRERLQEARKQADEIVERARKSGDVHEKESLEAARAKRDEMLEQTRREIEAETRRAIQEIRNEVADLTVMATEKVTRKTLSAKDQQKLIEEALSELDFAALAGDSEGRG